ncbi:MAG: DUF4249 domain-containing protein [Paludibacter sp.]|nr:DUF4249 domain-containing protein [Paludibacter sp.]
MKTMIKTIFLTLGLLLFVSCEKEIEFNGEISEPMVVLNSYISPDSIIYAHLTKSRFFLNNNRGFEFINNADILVYVNHVFREKLNFTENGIYRGTFKPTAGDTVRLLVKVTGYDDVESTTTVLSPSNILSTEAKMVEKSRDEYTINGEVSAHYLSGNCEFNVKIRDNVSEQNYYRLVVKKRNLNIYSNDTIISEYFINFSLEGFDSQSGDLIGLFDDGENRNDQHLITDELFNGKEFVLKFTTDYAYLEVVPGYEEYYNYKNPGGSESVIINLQAITKDMYLYLKSKESANGIFEGFFTEPVQIYNNISNGIGIFGAYTNNEFTYKLY